MERETSRDMPLVCVTRGIWHIKTKYFPILFFKFLVICNKG